MLELYGLSPLPRQALEERFGIVITDTKRGEGACMRVHAVHARATRRLTAHNSLPN